MLKALRHHPLLVGTAQVLTDGVRYVAIVVIVLLLVGQLAKVAL
jgi:MFS-type transporter involved in bile tolerance (Atg22 family)